jgi:hypothetical protein
MRHREQTDENETSTGAGSAGTLTEVAAADRPVPGKHRAHSPIASHPVPVIPAQKVPTHDTDAPAPAPAPEPARESATQPVTIPHHARWRASHLPRVLVGVLLGLSALGTTALALRFIEQRSSDGFASLVIGLTVIVVLWVLLIASTPQVVRLDGSVLSVHNTGGTERFDLADGLQPVDVVGNPRTSHWAVLLHRPNSTTVVLRHHDVVATELDPIVRHYRRVAEQRHTEREARFSR